MRIIYLSGWGSHIDESIHKILSKFGDEVIYPEIDYQNSRNLINAYANLAYNTSKPTLIIGTSLGAYIGYHISNIGQSPALLFNPTLFFKSGGELRPNNSSTGYDYLNKQFVFSMKDDEIDLKRTFKYLKEVKYEDENIKIYDDINQIPLDIFENEFNSFREKYKDFGLKKEEDFEESLKESIEKGEWSPTGKVYKAPKKKTEAKMNLSSDEWWGGDQPSTSSSTSYTSDGLDYGTISSVSSKKPKQIINGIF